MTMFEEVGDPLVDPVIVKVAKIHSSTCWLLLERKWNDL